MKATYITPHTTLLPLTLHAPLLEDSPHIPYGGDNTTVDTPTAEAPSQKFDAWSNTWE